MNFRITNHPVIPDSDKKTTITFRFNGKTCTATEGEMLSSALFANGIRIFGHHIRDGAPQGIFCANGQCSQCMVIADGVPVKSCMTEVRQNMEVKSLEKNPPLPEDDTPSEAEPADNILKCQVLIIGGGPAGINAAIELGKTGADVLLVDDKKHLGGKLTLQTHQFFGSVKDCYAGTRGTDIATLLAGEVSGLPNVKILTETTATGVYIDKTVGLNTKSGYLIAKPDILLIATGAREKTLPFPGADLPGVYGAGAFQTLVNRDLIKASERLFVIGGGNVGLIGAYHALQAGIYVAGLVEAMPECGGYKVHADKIKRLGVPVWTSHTVVRAVGTEKVEAVEIAEIDKNFKPVKGTVRRFEVDTVLVAVGLEPVNELYVKALEYGIPVFSAGDAADIAEASAAIFGGKIKGRLISRKLGNNINIPEEWGPLEEILKSRPGKTHDLKYEEQDMKVFPVIRCDQEIPCNPCVDACPLGSIKIEGTIMELPEFGNECIGCGQCVLACPGLAISLVFNLPDNKEKARIMLPFEFNKDMLPEDGSVETTDEDGKIVGKGKVVALRDRKSQNHRKLLVIEVPDSEKLRVAGIRIQIPEQGTPADLPEKENDPVICLCERVRKSEIVAAIRAGARDMNQLKSTLRTTMGACGGKNCTQQILKIFKEEGISPEEVTPPVIRPLFAEVRLGDFLKGE